MKFSTNYRPILVSLLIVCFIGASLPSVPITTTLVNDPQNSPHKQVVLSGGESWLTGWDYRKRLFFNEVEGSGTDYSFYVAVYHDTDDGSDGQDQICTEGNAQTDFDDVRFTDDDGITLLDYWRAQYTASDTAMFWFKLTDNVSSGSVTAYIYYGNTTVSYTGNGENVFDYFDDFEDGILDDWDLENNMEIKTDRKIGSYSAGVISSASAAALQWNMTSTITTDYCFGYSINHDNVLRGLYIFTYTEDNHGEMAGYLKSTYESSISATYYYDGSYKAWSGSADDITDDTWWDFEHWLDFDAGDPDMKLFHDPTGTLDLAYDGEEDWHETDDTDPETIAVEEFYLQTQATYDCWIDNVYGRKVVYSGEPYVSSIGAEEEFPPPEWNVISTPSLLFNMYSPWHIISTPSLLFPVAWHPVAQFGFDMLFIVLGLIMIPASTIYLVRGGWKEMSMDKVFLGLLLLIMGFGLVIGGVTP